MLILMNSDTCKTGPAIDYNKIDCFKYTIQTEGDNFGEMIAISYTPEHEIRRVFLSHITQDEYLSILHSISSCQIDYKGLFVPINKLNQIRNKTFAKQLLDYTKNGYNEKLIDFINKAFSEIKVTEYELFTNKEMFKIMDELYSNVEEYNILKHIYNYNNCCEITEHLVKDYEAGYLGKYND